MNIPDKEERVGVESEAIPSNLYLTTSINMKTWIYYDCFSKKRHCAISASTQDAESRYRALATRSEKKFTHTGCTKHANKVTIPVPRQTDRKIYACFVLLLVFFLTTPLGSSLYKAVKILFPQRLLFY